MESPARIARAIAARVARAAGYEVRRLLPPRLPPGQRYAYQRQYVSFNIAPGSRVLDIGSGHDPFPLATVLADAYLETTAHRAQPLKREGRTFVEANVEKLPFPDKSFDYVYCSHVLEHVADPILATSELMRVGQRGYIETPSILSDALFAWAKGMHSWSVRSIGNRLVFFEYDDRLSEGIRSTAWRDAIFAANHNVFQDVFNDNVDIFRVMFPWEKDFDVDVYYRDGRVRRGVRGKETA